MAKLNAAKRKALPASSFGMPKQRKYPMNDKEHAVLAKGRATQQVKKGKLSPSTAAKIKAKANKVLGGSKQRYDNPGHVSDNPGKKFVVPPIQW